MLERISIICLGLIGLLICLEAYRMGIGSLANPDQGFLPFLAGGVLFLLSVALGIRRIRQTHPAKPPQPFWPESRSKWRVGYVLGAILLYILAFKWMGFALATFLLFLFLLKTIDPVGWRKAILISAVATGVGFLVFQVGLKTQLPEGWLSWWRISKWIF